MEAATFWLSRCHSPGPIQSRLSILIRPNPVFGSQRFCSARQRRVIANSIFRRTGRTRVELRGAAARSLRAHRDGGVERRRMAERYAAPLASVARNLGGSFVMDLDDRVAQHGMGQRQLDFILTDLTRLGGPRFPRPPTACFTAAQAIKLHPPFKTDDGPAFAVPVDVPDGDTNEQPARSRLLLCEDGKPLGPAHSIHADVRERGGGR